MGKFPQALPSFTSTVGAINVSKRVITNNIRSLRFHHNEMTQKVLADKVGVTRQTIIAIEKAKYSPSLELAFLIALEFKKPFDEVFSYEFIGDKNA